MTHKFEAQNAEWQPSKVDGIFSKDLVSHPEGTGKLILLKPGAIYPKHKHPKRTEYAYVIEGQPTILVGETNYECASGEFVTMPPDTIHSLANHSEKDVTLFVGAIYHQ